MNNYVYIINNKIYINLTNKCSNDCAFCIRKGRQGMAGTELWIDSIPTAEEVAEQLPVNLDEYDKEVVFCGFGEPTYNLEALEEVADYLHCADKTTRINTNGQGNLICGRDITEEIALSCDVVNVSLNAPDAVKYNKLCRSRFGEDAFTALTEFAVLCKKHGAETIFSVVDDIPADDIAKCRLVAEKFDIPLRVRHKE